ncbi:MAG: GDP-mannose 4,6 dehydratase [Micrococcales bacterium]|nr:MAG: GDP-mannose 4,6 dehydratase [Micrococcales bacterium]PIE27819.1 MAG: GDP-mannose 4,6 dehydratase [Micrococcales bacterium]
MSQHASRTRQDVTPREPVALVTGSAGQDGGFLCERLLAEGYQVHACVRGPEEVDPQFTPWLTRAQVHDVDFAEPEQIGNVITEVRPDEIYNLAALSSVGLSWSQPLLTARINGLAVAQLLESALQLQQSQDRPVRVVIASSAEVFGNAEQAPQNEDTPIRPVNPYGAAKAYAHHLATVYRGHGLHASACVLFPHESTRRPTDFVTRKITSTVAAIVRGQARELVLGNLDVRRDWGWAPDYVDGMIRAARLEQAEDFVFATGQDHSIEEFVAAAFAAAGIEDWRRLVRQDPQFMRPAEATRQVGDARKARSLLGWAPTVEFEEIVARMVRADLADT